jgi:hypothetical protein
MEAPAWGPDGRRPAGRDLASEARGFLLLLDSVAVQQNPWRLHSGVLLRGIDSGCRPHIPDARPGTRTGVRPRGGWVRQRVRSKKRGKE